MIKNLLFAAVLIINFVIAGFFNITQAFAQNEFDFAAVKKEGDIFERRYYDIDGDGETETIALKAYNMQISKEGDTEEIMSYSGLLTVFKKDKAGKENVLWQAKAPAKSEENSRNAIDFLFCPYGLEPIEACGNITGSQAVEIISPAVISDLRPVTYRLIKWDNAKKEFTLYKCAILKGALENPSEFIWAEYKDEEIQKCSWIGKILKINSPGVVEAEIWSYSNEKARRGIAVLKCVKDVFTVDKWIENPKTFE
ncbi:MAG TPA: hypothetical protein PK467_01740 [Candidatus Wallbacteria bacterium]|nr:hypothetical protein [Candidatus Wallbacteria bacterium]